MYPNDQRGDHEARGVDAGRHPRHDQINGPTAPFRCKLGALLAATLLTLPAAAIVLAPPAAANSTATAPQQLVHAYPLGPQRLCCTSATTGQTATRPRPSRASRTAPLPGGTRPAGASNPLPIILLGAVLAVLLTAVMSATYGARRRRAAAALSAEIAANRRATTEAASSAATGDRARDGRVRFGRLSHFGERVRSSRDEAELTVGSIEGPETEIAAAERADRRADAGRQTIDAFDIGVLFHERGDHARARGLTNGPSAEATPTRASTSGSCCIRTATSTVPKPPGGGPARRAIHRPPRTCDS